MIRVTWPGGLAEAGFKPSSILLHHLCTFYYTWLPGGGGVSGLLSTGVPSKVLPVADLLLICRSQDLLISEEFDSKSKENKYLKWLRELYKNQKIPKIERFYIST